MQGDPAQIGSSATEPDEVQVIPRRKASSVAPVGLDVTGKPFDPDRTNPSLRRRKIPQRRNLLILVAAAVTACALLLIVALVERAARPHENVASAATAIAPAPKATAPPAAPVATEVPTGTLIIVRPALPGYVWLDGKKLTGTSAVVACGNHQIKVNSFGKTRPIYIPCGAEIRVWR
jgi:hypothetical protein